MRPRSWASSSSEVERQAVGVVEPEGVGAGEDRAARRRGAPTILLELAKRLLERGAEALLLGAHHARDGRRAGAAARGRRRAMRSTTARDQLVQERLLDAELAARGASRGA